MLAYWQRNVYDLLMLGIVVLTFLAAVRYGIRQRNYVVGIGWTVPLACLSAHYALLSLDLEPYGSTSSLQLSVVQPSLFFLLVFISVFLFNGRVNTAIARIHLRLAQVWTLVSGSKM